MKIVLKPVFAYMLVLFLTLASRPHFCFAYEMVKDDFDFHTVHSKASNQDYRLWVFTPKDYSPDKNIEYPVVYTLVVRTEDIPSTTELYNQIISENETAEFIMVAIGFESDLEHDGLLKAQLTPSNRPEQDTFFLNQIKENWPIDSPINEKIEARWRTGQATLLSDTIIRTIIPFVEKNYKTNKDRCLMGHSLGGLFVTHFMLTNPKIFDKYWISSPSYWWDTVDIIQKEVDYTNEYKDMDIKIFFSVGELEPIGMIKPLTLLVNLLKSRNYPGLKLKYEIFKGEDHMSVIQPGVKKGIEYLLL